jgi:hypothetical protein
VIKVNFYRAKKDYPLDYTVLWEALMFPKHFFYRIDNFGRDEAIDYYLCFTRLCSWGGVRPLSPTSIRYIKQVEGMENGLETTDLSNLYSYISESEDKSFRAYTLKMFALNPKHPGLKEMADKLDGIIEGVNNEG